MSPLNPAYLAYDKLWRGKGGSEGSSPLEAALSYARRGWPVIPVWWSSQGQCACGVSDCSSPGKHPLGALVPHGVKDAATSPEVIKSWWHRYPAANV
ncbi:MAG: bifunctional DNA primase/polymerase, partial [Deltaproteobacteria bacterium]|nr:bifunctional DNA primase/polymerase [Deltaproteobacteria bacterium]